MKIIKFRGKDRDNIFQYGDLTHEDNLVFVDEIRVDPDSVAQLIGIDKNGNEIYEGDEIKSCLGSSCYANFRHYGGIIDGAYSLVQTRIIGGKEK